MWIHGFGGKVALRERIKKQFAQKNKNILLLMGKHLLFEALREKILK